jgi:cyclomaltodextrinase
MIRRVGALGLVLATALGFAVHSGPRVSASEAKGASLGLALYHNGWDSFYRWPFGAAATGSTDTFRLRSSRGVTRVTFDLVNEANGGATPYPMKLQSHNGTQDFWRAAVVMPAKHGQMGYHFRVQAGKNVRWYGDNSSVGESGPGQTYGSLADVLDYNLTVYQAGFTTPTWLQKAVIYEIFPDRFYDGDKSNDALESTGTKYGYIDTIFHKNWDSLPVENNPCPDPSGSGNDNCDFFGGDLQGVIDKLPYLHTLGITAIYLTPIFLAPSNHKYDTSNFKEIDPEFGTLHTFQTLASDARKIGIHLILDGAFEDTGSDSVYFDYYGNFSSQYGPGACDSSTSQYYTWYSIYSATGCSLYKEWFGIQTLPSLNDNLPSVRKFFYKGPQSVAQYWLHQGASGWRLDSADQISDSFWQGFRTNVKAAFPNAAIIGEDFSGDPTSELLGTEWDGSMNYRFRDPALDFFANGNGSQNRTAEGASDFLETEMGLLSQEPWQADLASMNILDSQDTVRLFSSIRENMKAMQLVSLFQMTWPGVPTIFYGDEAGLQGLGDPDNRRTFPWDHQNAALEAYYTKIIHMRLAINALVYGAVTPLLMNDSTRTVAYLRQTSTQSVVVVLNDSAKAETVKLPVTTLKSGTVLTDQLVPYSATVAKGSLTVTLPPMSGRVLLATVG